MAVQNFGTGGGGYQLSPGINVSEVDLTTVAPAVDTTVGAYAGVFRWGPVNERVLVTSENDLVGKFGKPTNINPETFFTAANFLSYSNALYVVRAANTTAQFAAMGGDAVVPTISATITLTGNVTVANTSANVTGFGTSFSTEILAGDTITNANGTIGTVSSISNNTLLILTANSSQNLTQAVVSGNRFSTTIGRAALTVFNNNEYENKSAAWNNTGAQFVARWPGALGNSLKVSMCSSDTQYATSSNLLSTSYTASNGTNTATASFNGPTTGFSLAVGSTTGTITLDGSTSSTGANIGGINYYANSLSTANLTAAAVSATSGLAVGDFIVVGTGSTQSLKIVSKSANSNNTSGIATVSLTFDQPLKLATNISSNTVARYWEYYSQVDAAPGRSTYVTVNGNTAAQLGNTAAQNDEVHVIVVDEDGAFTGSPGAVLEVWQRLSRASDAKLADGSSNFFKTVINTQSSYIWAAADRSGAATNTAVNITSSSATAPLTVSLTGGVDQAEETVAFTSIAAAYDQFVSPEDVDISLVLTGRTRGGDNGTQLANYLIDNIAETRKDCVVFVSPEKADTVNATSPDTNIVQFRNSLRSSSYAVLDSGYKQQYDKYNDLYRWIPLNGDIAGLCVRTDRSRDPWFSPAGTARGQIKNVIKLAFNPNRAQRDLLYKNGINPVVSESAQGTILYGDKTLLSKPSAFDRINVRRLFIVLEKSISAAAKSLLFEFNDEFTRAQFRNLVEPFLRDVQGRRGIYDFRVVCDETNNTPEVIDANRFVGDIYIKPARSINYIQLNFVAVRSGVEFSEIVG
jgi:phage tail sheath protein FI